MNESDNLAILIIFLLPLISATLRKGLLSYENLHLKSMHCSNNLLEFTAFIQNTVAFTMWQKLNHGKTQTSLQECINPVGVWSRRAASIL